MKTLIHLLPAVLLLILILLQSALASAPPIQWQKTFGGSDYDYAHSVQQTSDGGYIIAGIAGDDPFPQDAVVYLIKTDPNGDDLWHMTFGGDDYDTGRSVVQTSDGGYIIAGLTDSYGAGNWDVYFIKLCPDGILSADFNCDGTVYYEDLDMLASEWLQPPVMVSADIFPKPCDGIVNAFDFAIFANDWLQTTIP